jgi:hypothetical protein
LSAFQDLCEKHAGGKMYEEHRYQQFGVCKRRSDALGLDGLNCRRGCMSQPSPNLGKMPLHRNCIGNGDWEEAINIKERRKERKIIYFLNTAQTFIVLH